ncbi:DnaB-like helicase N-terminal domain-containing protein [Actinophytocola sp.]|uniref:DnaB-like helicase N-terminal domain-containing protein n=1 Tax=Actinophytocola sp. TaxID=1872138 RepID=UPI0038998142
MTAPRVESGLDAPHSGAAAGTAAGASGWTGGATWLAERAVLATLLYRPERLTDLELWLRAGDFADPQHAAVYATIAGLRAAGELRAIHPEVILHDSDVRSAILDNVVAVQEALHAGRFADTPLPHGGVRDFLGAASNDGPDLLVRYGQMVLESSARRRLQDWAVYFVQPVRAPQYGVDTREFSPIHDGLVNDLADLEQRSAHSTVSGNRATYADLEERDAPLLGGPLVVPAAAPAHKLVERAERDVLTAALSDTSGQHRRLLDRFEPGDFTASPRHASTWRAIQAVARRGEPVTAITVAWEAERLPADHGPALSAEELVDLAAAPAPATVRRQTMTIVRASLYNRIQHAGDHLDRAARDRSRGVDQVLNAAQGVAQDLREQASRLVGEHVRSVTANRIAQQLDGSPAPRQR